MGNRCEEATPLPIATVTTVVRLPSLGAICYNARSALHA